MFINVTFSLSIIISFKLQQPENALSPIKVTLAGILTFVKLLQPTKAFLPIKVTLSRRLEIQLLVFAKT